MSRKTQHAVGEAAERFLTQASTGTCTSPIAMPCESQEAAHDQQFSKIRISKIQISAEFSRIQQNQQFRKAVLGALKVTDCAIYFSLLREGLTITEVATPSEQTHPGMGWVPLLVVPLSVPPQYLYLHTQMVVQVNYIGK